MTKFFIGTSGYSYKDWEGEFYPVGINSNQYLQYYNKFFNTVEINSTYYSLPSPFLFLNMKKKVNSDFLFSVKAYHQITHERNADDSIYESFLKALDPIIESNNLGVILFQFPYSFNFNKNNFDYLKKIKEKFKDIKITYEFRNINWLNDKVIKLLTELDIGFCNVDEPKFAKLLPQTNILTSDIFYLRFHGRNYAKWWSSDEAFERYDYMYKQEELEEWIPKIKEASLKAKKMLIYFNNHYKAKSVKSANLLINLLSLTKEMTVS